MNAQMVEKKQISRHKFSILCIMNKICLNQQVELAQIKEALAQKEDALAQNRRVQREKMKTIGKLQKECSEVNT